MQSDRKFWIISITLYECSLISTAFYYYRLRPRRTHVVEHQIRMYAKLDK